jgi:hypothetical protein
VTLSPTATLTVLTSQVLLPLAPLDELDELEAVDDTSWGWLPKARP